MRQGTFDRSEGKKIIIVTSKGEWFMFPDKSCEGIRNLPQGTPVEFEASKPDGKNYWRMTSYKRTTSPQQATNGQAQATHDTAEEIFVTGVVGRAMGSGKFGVEDIEGLTKAAMNAWRERHRTYFERQESDDGPPPYDPEDDPFADLQ